MTINGIRKIESLNLIPKGNYQGYYWMSNDENPEHINGSFNPPATTNPFIIEAMLWDQDAQKSIMITHTGRCQIFEYDLKILEKEGKLEDKTYMPHRLEGVKKVKFKQFWKEEKDPLCENMPVMQLKAQIFIGFA